MEAGQETTHFILHPGEKVRTPLMALQFYKGGAVRSQNIWRQWMRDHNFPKLGGKVPVSMLEACSSPEFVEMTKATAKDGWNLPIGMPRKASNSTIGGWMPGGISYITTDGKIPGRGKSTRIVSPRALGPHENAHKKGVKLLVWFDPSEWLHTHGCGKITRSGSCRQRMCLNGSAGCAIGSCSDLGNPEAFNG